MSAEESRRVEEKLMEFHSDSKDGKHIVFLSIELNINI